MMQGIGLGLVMGLSLVTMYAQQQAVIAIMLVECSLGDVQNKFGLSKQIKQNGSSIKALPMSSSFQPEQKKLEVPTNWHEIAKIEDSSLITYDAKNTKRYEWQSNNKKEESGDFVATIWPPTQWYLNKISSHPVILINTISKAIYAEFEQDILNQFSHETIEFISQLDAKSSFLKDFGFVARGGHLSKEIDIVEKSLLSGR